MLTYHIDTYNLFFRINGRIKKLTKYNLSDYLGIVGLHVYAFGVFYRPFVAQIGMLSMLIGVLLAPSAFKKKIYKNHLFILSSLSLLYFSAMSIISMVEFSEFTLIAKGLFKAVQLGFFTTLLLSIWIQRFNKQLDFIIFLIVLGFFIKALKSIDLNYFITRFKDIIEGAYRLDVGFSTNRLGIFSCFICLCCILFPRQVMFGNIKRRFIAIGQYIFWGLVFLFSIFGVLYSQSRAAWIASIIILIPISIYRFLCSNKLARIFQIAIVVLFIFAGYLLGAQNIVAKRLFLNSNTIKLNYDNDYLDELASDKSFQHRLMLIKISKTLILERPLFGFGPNVSDILIEKADENFEDVKKYRNFHNAIIDVMIQFGVIGLVFYSIFFYLSFKELIYANSNKLISIELSLFIIGGLIILTIGSFLGNFFNFNNIYLLSLICGICFSYHIDRWPTNK